VLALTVYQVVSPSSGLGLGLKPDEKATDNIALNMGIRLFAWILTGALVYMLMYGKSDPSLGRSSKTRSTGLMLSLLNLVLWALITVWYFRNIHGN
jgi:hypothetical protein